MKRRHLLAAAPGTLSALAAPRLHRSAAAWLAAAGATGIAAAARAQGPNAEETVVADVRYPRGIELGGRTLRLNGAGIRYKAIFKVYTAGLYLDKAASSVEEVVANRGPRRMHIVMLRAIDANELGKLFTKGMEQNASREEFVKAIPGTVHLGEIFADHKRLEPGDAFSVDWLPGQGTQILVNGRQLGQTIAAPEFFNALMRIWLGRSPADPLLKDALLAQERPT